MSNWFILFVYIFMCYGFTYMVTNSVGPKNIFLNLREWAEDVGPNFGLLFRCALCFPTNLGWVLSLLNWFLLPQLAITPFNMILQGLHDQWWLVFVAMAGDAGFTGAVCKIIYNVDDFIDKSTPIFVNNEGEDEDY